MMFGFFAASLLATGCTMFQANYPNGKTEPGAVVKVYENKKFTGQFGILDMWGRCALPLQMGKAPQVIVVTKDGKKLYEGRRTKGNMKVSLKPMRTYRPRPNVDKNGKGAGDMRKKGKGAGTGRAPQPNRK